MSAFLAEVRKNPDLTIELSPETGVEPISGIRFRREIVFTPTTRDEYDRLVTALQADRILPLEGI